MSRCYPEVEGTEWFHLPRGGMRIACCDCNLVHDLDYRKRGGRIEIRMARNERATAALRRKTSKSEVRRLAVQRGALSV